MALNLLLAWGFGLVILGALWWLSMPARTWWITTIAGLSLLVSAFAGAASLAMLVQRMREEHAGDPPRLWSNAPAMAVLLVAAPAVVIVGLQRTMGSADSLAHLSLMGENIVEKPVGWLSYAEAKAEFQTAWCSRENIPKCTDLGTRFTEFEKAWKTRRIAALSDLRKPLWHKPSQMKPDFRKGFLSEAFVSGINLSWAQMQEALLDGAQLEGAKLYKAQMMGAFLSNSQMQGADLQQAQLQKALFSNAQFQGSNFRWAQLQGAFLNQTQLQGANLYGAQMREVFLRGAQMEGTILHLSLLTGRADRTYHLSETNLVASKNSGGALRFLDLTHARIDQSTDWSNVFLDGSVIVPEDMRKQIGQPCLWAWIAEHPEPLTDAEFFGRWRGWLLLAPNRRDLYWGSMLSVPEEWRDVAPILPPSGCTWKTEPLPAAD